MFVCAVLHRFRNVIVRWRGVVRGGHVGCACGVGEGASNYT